MIDLARRGFLMATAVAGLSGSGAALPRVAGQVRRTLPDLNDPRNNLRALVRVQGSLKEEDVPWWYDGTIYGIVGEEAPRPLVKFEGMEMYWMRHLGPDEYELIGNTVTFFRDLETGEMLEEFDNPYTGETNKVSPAAQGGGAGRGFNYSLKGIRPTRFMDKMPEKTLVLDWSMARGHIWMHNETVYPPGLPPPRAQRQTMFVALDDFLDDTRASLPTLFSSTVFMPWLRWMDMGERPGHVVWHASGAKLRSIDELPADYRARAEKEFPERMSANPNR